MTFLTFVVVGLAAIGVLTQTSAIDEVQRQLGGATPDSSVIGPFSVNEVLWLAIPVGSLFFAAIFAAVAGAGLRPVRRMMNEADSIEMNDLERRLGDPATGDEVSDLAVTLNKMLDRVSRGVAVQRQFVTDAAHELRSPIAASTSLLEVGLTIDSTDWESTASAVLAEQRRLAGLVDDLVMLARFDEGGLASQGQRSIPLDDVVVAEASTPFSVGICVVAIEPAAIYGEEWSIVRMVRNLLTNAERHAESQIEVRVVNELGQTVLTVDDDGPGIAEIDRARIFDRFARLDEARSREAGGSGIGLSIVKQVVEFHHGTVAVGDSPLGGARFTVTFPSAVS